MFGTVSKIKLLVIYITTSGLLAYGCASSGGGKDEFEDDFGDNINNSESNEDFSEFENENPGFNDNGFSEFQNNGQFANDGEFENSAENSFSDEFQNDEFADAKKNENNLFGNVEFVNNAEPKNDVVEKTTKNQNSGDLENNNVIVNIEEPNNAAVFIPLTAKVDPNAVTQYILPGGSSLHTEPDSSAIRTLEQGDHPLVFGDGDWVSTSDGYYIPSQSLSRSPVGRRKLKPIWQ